MKTVVINYLKSHKNIMYLMAFLYSVAHGSNVWRFVFRKDVCLKGAFLKNTRLQVGSNAKVFIGEKCQMRNCVLTVANGGEMFVDGSKTCILNARLVVRERGRIAIGDDFSMQGGTIQSVDGMPVEIGSHCMFSGDIDILSGDLHPIFTKDDRKIINNARAVSISDNVWLGAHVKVLKGVYIAPHVVVGSSSLVSGKILDSYSVYCGVPAKMIKSGVDWARGIEDVNIRLLGSVADDMLACLQ